MPRQGSIIITKNSGACSTRQQISNKTLIITVRSQVRCTLTRKSRSLRLNQSHQPIQDLVCHIWNIKTMSIIPRYPRANTRPRSRQPRPRKKGQLIVIIIMCGRAESNLLDSQWTRDRPRMATRKGGTIVTSQNLSH
jgi:hypothetical protein